MKRRLFGAAAALAVAGMVLSGCGNTEPPAGGGGTIASQMIFGGPPEFKTRADGIPGLKENYDVEFGKYTVTDVGGPVTVKALVNGQVDAADLFTTDPSIEANDFVVLEDPENNFAAQNIVPLITKAKNTPAVTKVLDDISAELTTEDLSDMLDEAYNDKTDPAKIAADYVEEKGWDTKGTSTKGVTLTVGSANFPENVILAEIYAQSLEAQGATIKRKLNIGSREKYYPALEQGSLDLFPEYTGTILTYLDKDSKVSAPDEVYDALTKALPDTLEALDYAPEAQDSDAIVVTKETAEKFNLKTIGDLAKQAE